MRSVLLEVLQQNPSYLVLPCPLPILAVCCCLIIGHHNITHFWMDMWMSMNATQDNRQTPKSQAPIKTLVGNQIKCVMIFWKTKPPLPSSIH